MPYSFNKHLLPPVIYEDDNLIAFDKPSGLLTVPDRWDKERENLMDWVHRELAPNWFNVHRLDRETSGVLLCAKSKPVLDELARMFEKHEVEKDYLAIVCGGPRAETGEMNWALAPDESVPGKMRVCRRGKPALSVFTVLKRWRAYALVRLTPRTGRTHQLRVHLAASGCPILADALYGDGRGLFLSKLKPGYKQKASAERPLMGRLALHAERLALRHPVTGMVFEICAPQPKEFRMAIKYLDLFG
jgi:RluA family pseudouridine synthase